MVLRVVFRVRAPRLRVERIPGLDQPAAHPLRLRIAQQHRDQVQRVRVVLDQVGVGEHQRGLRFANLAGGYGLRQRPKSHVVAAHRAPVERHTVARHGIPDPVRLGQRGAQPLLAVDGPHAVLGAIDQRLGPRK